MGLNDGHTEGVFRWVDSMAVGPWTRWASGEPNGGQDHDCVTIGLDTFWRDTDCNMLLPYICQSVDSRGKMKSFLFLHWPSSRRWVSLVYFFECEGRPSIYRGKQY